MHRDSSHAVTDRIFISEAMSASEPSGLVDFTHCFVTQHALATDIRSFPMLAPSRNNKNQRPPSRTVAYLLLLLICLWAFVDTIDGPAVNVGIGAGSVVYKMPKVVGGEHGSQPGPLWLGVFPEEPPPVHASFLLFDFKQNLRRWPNVAGDISRSPPFFLAI